MLSFIHQTDEIQGDSVLFATEIIYIDTQTSKPGGYNMYNSIEDGTSKPLKVNFTVDK